MKKLKALIIGAGSIGATKPDHLDYPGSEHILTHANAVTRHPDVDLVGVVDIDPQKGSDASRKWNCNNYLSIKETFNSNKIDIVVLSVPTEKHGEMMLDLSQYDFKLLIAEKPFCGNVNDAIYATNSYSSEGIPVLVGYIRRFDEGHKKVKQLIDDEVFGGVQNCRITYTRGLYADGCHGIDLCNYFFGEFLGGNKLNFGPITEIENDTSWCLQMVYEKCHNILLIPCDGRKYSIFDVDIFFEKGRINLRNHGNIINYYTVHDSCVYGQYNTLSHTYATGNPKYGLTKALYNLIDTAVRTVRGQKVEYGCSGEDAVRVHEVLNHILKG